MRDIIKIDEDICNGCGLCVPGCPEGALQVIDGKARLISDLMCDGLGACLGECPEGAISIEKREAEPYDELLVIPVIAKQGKNTTIAHLKHLKDHGEHTFLKQAVSWLTQHPDKYHFDFEEVRNIIHHYHPGNGNAQHNARHFAESINIHNLNVNSCPGSQMMTLHEPQTAVNSSVAEIMDTVPQFSELRQWPVQLHLLSPNAPYFKGADVLLTADCVAYTLGDFHSKWLKGKSLAIACPKLDHNQEVYLQKLIAMIEQAKINTLSVMIMEVPCCGGLFHLAITAAGQAKRKIPVKKIIVGIKGNILREELV